MQDLAVSGYTSAAVKDMLHMRSVERHESFRYDLLDKTNAFKMDGTALMKTARVGNNALADIKRTARFTMFDSSEVDWESDRVKPYVRLQMPDGNWVEWAQGVFLLSTPTREVSGDGMAVTREIEAYDQGAILFFDKVLDRYTVVAGTNYITAVETILLSAGITLHNLVATDKTLPVDLDWEPGTPKNRIINDLLDAINYRAIWFDWDGRAIAEPYVSPDDAAPEYNYVDDGDSVMIPQVKETLELYNVPNVWRLVVSEPDRDPLIATYSNDDPASPTSTFRRGYNSVDYREDESAVDQATLDEKILRIAFEASQVYGIVEFQTLIMPHHSHADVFNIGYSEMSINNKHSEHEWSFDMKSGARMQHKVRRVVSV